MTQTIEILLVEDNPNDVELTLHALKENNLTNVIEVVRDGEEALDFIFATGPYSQRGRERRPILICLDLKLPKVDGLEVLKRVKADPLTRMIPVVVLTSSREERDIVESYQLGSNSYIAKPVDFEQFTEAMRQLGFYWLLVNRAPIVGKYLSLRRDVLTQAPSASAGSVGRVSNPSGRGVRTDWKPVRHK